MEVKKATTVCVEVITMADGNVSYTLRLMSGQPIRVLSTPAELTAVFQELSSDINSQED